MVDRLASGLGADETQIYRIESTLDLADLGELATLDRPELKYEPWLPVVPPRLAAAQSNAPRLFDEIRKGDLGVHQPYESFRGSFEVLVQAERPAPVDAQRLERGPPSRESLVVDREDAVVRGDEPAARDRDGDRTLAHG